MAQKDTVIAQAATLGEWADQWERDPVEGGSEVVFLLRRAARMMNRCIGVESAEPDASELKEADPVDDLRP